MKTYFENGTLQEVPCFLDKSDMFYIQELEGDHSDKYVYPGDSIKYDLDTELVSLYDRFRDAFFEDTNEYYRELRQLPIFVQEAGQDSECSLTAEVFRDWIQ